MVLKELVTVSSLLAINDASFNFSSHLLHSTRIIAWNHVRFIHWRQDLCFPRLALFLKLLQIWSIFFLVSNRSSHYDEESAYLLCLLGMVVTKLAFCKDSSAEQAPRLLHDRSLKTRVSLLMYYFTPMLPELDKPKFLMILIFSDKCPTKHNSRHFVIQYSY